MKKRYLGLPVPLKKQVLIRTGLMIAAFAVAVSMLVMGMEIFIILSVVLIAAFFVFSAFSVLYSEYIEVRGKCIERTKNLIRTRTKWLVVQSGDTVMKIRISGGRNLSVREDDAVTVYLRTKAKLYERDGIYTVYDYLAIEKDLQKVGRV